MQLTASLLHVFLALCLAPLLPGIINRTKAFFGGRHGQPVLQAYFDLAKLFRKGAVFSRTTTWVFRAGPIVNLTCVILALLLAPLLGVRGLLAFQGDLILLVYLLALVRFITILAALDTGSSLEGMGASREVLLSTLAEPALFLGLAAMAALSRRLSLTEMFADPLGAGPTPAPALALVAAAFLIVLLTENSRIPVDDPNTHLELTMIHEVMVLDHGGVDLGFIQYASALKLWVLAAILAGVAMPIRTGTALGDLVVGLAVQGMTAVLIGIIESSMARLRMVRLPQMLVTASVLSVLAFALAIR